MDRDRHDAKAEELLPCTPRCNQQPHPNGEAVTHSVDCPKNYRPAVAAALRAQSERRILTRCLSCGNQTLFISDMGEITCSWLQCKGPCVSLWAEAHKAEVERREKLQSELVTVWNKIAELHRSNLLWFEESKKAYAQIAQLRAEFAAARVTIRMLEGLLRGQGIEPPVRE